MGGDEVLGDEVRVLFTVASGVGECLFCQGQHFGWVRVRGRERGGRGGRGGRRCRIGGEGGRRIGRWRRSVVQWFCCLCTQLKKCEF